jgi:hypothetical protein
MEYSFKQQAASKYRAESRKVKAKSNTVTELALCRVADCRLPIHGFALI